MLTADEHGGPSWFEGLPQLPQRWVPCDVEDEVVLVRGVVEVLLLVVDDMVGAEGGDEFDLGRAADARDLGTKAWAIWTA